MRENPQNRWSDRKNMVCALVKFHDFDVLCTQEGVPEQIDYLNASLSDYASAAFYMQHDSLQSPGCAIFYKKSRLKLLESGKFKHVKNAAPSKSSARITAWAKFEDVCTNRKFYVFNTHFAAGKNNADNRMDSAEITLEKISELAADSPAFLCGDFNATENSAPISAILASGKFFDSKKTSSTPHYGPEKTFNGFKTDAGIPADPPEKRAALIERALPIDFIFTTKNVRVKTHATITDSFYGKFPSDHFPVVVNVELEE